MDSYVKITEQLFNAAKSVFKNIEQFYFHNCLYRQVWKHNERVGRESYSTLKFLERMEEIINVFLLVMPQ